MTAEEYIKKYTRNCSNEITQWKPTIHGGQYPVTVGYKPWLTPENAEEVAVMAKDEALNNLWHDAQGDDLPEIDREVIVLTQPYPLEGSEFAVSFAHRPNPDGWDGKSLTSGKVEHYTPKTYDKGGWNIPDVRFWLDVKLPKEIEL